MVEISEHVQQDLQNIREKLQKSRHDPSPEIFLISGALESPFRKMHEALISLPSIKEIENVQYLEEMQNKVVSSERLFPYVNLYQSSFEDLEGTIKECYSVIKNSTHITPVILISEQDLMEVKKIIDEESMLSHFFSLYKLGKVSKKTFETWLKEQFPIYITDKAVEILNDGIKNDFSKARMLRDIFFEKESFKLSFVKKNGKLTQVAQFTGEILLSEEGEKLSVPSNFFMFDTSAVVSESLPQFIKYIGEGKWIYPSFIRKEVHNLEEEGKRGGSVDPRQIKSNLDLLDKKFEIVKHSYPKSRVKAKNVDSRLVDVALETGAILVTADEMISKDCKVEGVPVVLFTDQRDER